MSCVCRIIRRININGSFRSLQTHAAVSRTPNVLTLLPQTRLTENPWIWRKNDPFNFPVINNHQTDLPISIRREPLLDFVNPLIKPNLECPTQENSDTTKEAARLIVIRRKKMKKHKLRKLRKRMKFEWAKKRQRRELRKEKEFQAVLVKQCKDAEAFSAESYVAERIQRLNTLLEAAKSESNVTTKQNK